MKRYRLARQLAYTEGSWRIPPKYGRKLKSNVVGQIVLAPERVATALRPRDASSRRGLDPPPPAVSRWFVRCVGRRPHPCWRTSEGVRGPGRAVSECGLQPQVRHQFPPRE